VIYSWWSKKLPSKSKAQEKLMNIAAHTQGGYGGVPKAVGKEFHEADKKKFKRSSSKEMASKMYKS
jgi:hypothetical protein